ncbi:hypothetical protein Dsin_013463 [Dipteronia sinensis]|uniref:SWIM-type domain-containing protein n=1 Tax=Dipteronia sinensis TaxID=43782 RepID=A0AAE0AK11_9ROSI|nr:hypothetical protein Dsin_013463 [Dipteronia sinensis]
MMKVPLKQWDAHAFDANVKSEHTTNNITECFNGWVNKYMGNPAITLLENIRRKLMRRMSKREEGRKWGSKVPPKVAKKMAERQNERRFVNVFCGSPDVYEVKEGQKFWIVDFQTWSCDCGLWEISGIHCKHAMAVITGRRMNSNDFVHKYLTTEAYIKTYSYVIYHIPDETQWPQVQHVEVLPPIEKKLPGRPKKNRKRGADEPRKNTRNSRNRCGNCGELGHNVRSCKAATVTSSNQTKGKGAQSSGGVGNIHGTYLTLSSIVGGTITQSITSNAPLQPNHNAPPIGSSSRSSLGIVAGLDMEWNPVF